MNIRILKAWLRMWRSILSIVVPLVGPFVVVILALSPNVHPTVRGIAGLICVLGLFALVSIAGSFDR